MIYNNCAQSSLVAEDSFVSLTLHSRLAAAAASATSAGWQPQPSAHSSSGLHKMAALVGPHNETYEEFYSTWTKTQEDLMKELQEALESDMKEHELLQVVEKVVQHYDDYYNAKERASHQNILKTVDPSWRSPLEKAFLWLSGWRPSLAFQLVYALAGQQIEAELAEFLQGVDIPTFSSLSSIQLSHISELQTSTNKQEENLDHDMAVLQQSFADQPLLTLAQADNMVKGGNESPAQSPHGDHHDDMDSAMNEKLTSLQEISAQADSLRRTTLKKVLNVLDTFQKAQYLVSAAKLQVAIRNIGEKMDDDSF